MRKALMLFLLLLVILMALPAIAMGDSMEPCPACEPALGHVLALCLAVLTALALTVPLILTSFQTKARQFRPLLLSLVLERPPRSV